MRKLKAFCLVVGDVERTYWAETFEDAAIQAAEELGPEWPMDVIVRNLVAVGDERELEMDLDEADSRKN